MAVLCHTAALSGAEIALLRLVRALDRRRLDLTFVIFSDGPLVTELTDAGFDVRVLPLDSRVATAERHAVARLAVSRIGLVVAAVRYTLGLARYLRRLDVEVVHTNSLKSDVIGGVAARLARRRLVWYVHDRISADYLPARTTSALRWAARHIPHQVIANSRATLDTLGPIPTGHFAIAYPGLDSQEFTLRPSEAPPGPRIGMIGRISPTKGQDIFLRAAAEVVTTHPDAQFVVMGAVLFNEGDFEKCVHAIADELALGDRVRFVGHVPDVAGEMRRFTALVHASPVPEPFGQVVVEAMAAGVPVVATDAGGVAEILRDDGPLGRLVPPGDVHGLADAIRWVLDHPDEARQTTVRARASAQRRFTIEQTAQVVESVWNRAVSAT